MKGKGNSPVKKVSEAVNRQMGMGQLSLCAWGNTVYLSLYLCINSCEGTTAVKGSDSYGLSDCLQHRNCSLTSLSDPLDVNGHKVEGATRENMVQI